MPNDLIDAIERVLSPLENRVVNVVGPEAISFGEILSRLSEARHQNLHITQVPRILAVPWSNALARIAPM